MNIKLTKTTTESWNVQQSFFSYRSSIRSWRGKWLAPFPKKKLLLKKHHVRLIWLNSYNYQKLFLCLSLSPILPVSPSPLKDRTEKITANYGAYILHNIMFNQQVSSLPVIICQKLTKLKYTSKMCHWPNDLHNEDECRVICIFCDEENGRCLHPYIASILTHPPEVTSHSLTFAQHCRRNRNISPSDIQFVHTTISKWK